jgi:hypothetical protein
MRQARAAAIAAQRRPPPEPVCEKPGLFGELLGREPVCRPASRD